jgi:hypothetical protein
LKPKAGEDERLLIDAAAQTIQTTALELGIHIVLVMHPAKIRAGEDGRARQPEIGDLKGSSGPAQFADNVLRIGRDAKSPRAVLTILKCRSELGQPGHVAYAFDPEALRFADVHAQADGDKGTEGRRRDGRAAAAGEEVEERMEATR